MCKWVDELTFCQFLYLGLWFGACGKWRPPLEKLPEKWYFHGRSFMWNLMIMDEHIHDLRPSTSSLPQSEKTKYKVFLTKSLLLPRYITWAISHQALMHSICWKIQRSSPPELPFSMVRTGWNCTGVASCNEVWTLQCAPDLTTPSHLSVPETRSQLTLIANWGFLLKCLL